MIYVKIVINLKVLLITAILVKYQSQLTLFELTVYWDTVRHYTHELIYSSNPNEIGIIHILQMKN